MCYIENSKEILYENLIETYWNVNLDYKMVSYSIIETYWNVNVGYKIQFFLIETKWNVKVEYKLENFYNRSRLKCKCGI